MLAVFAHHAAPVVDTASAQKIPVDETEKRKTLAVTLGFTFKGSAEILEASQVPFPQSLSDWVLCHSW